jgi:hypothetical protein
VATSLSEPAASRAKFAVAGSAVAIAGVLAVVLIVRDRPVPDEPVVPQVQLATPEPAPPTGTTTTTPLVSPPERSGSAAIEPAITKSGGPNVAVDKPSNADKPQVVAPAMGTLLLASTPLCDVAVDGSSIHRRTPLRGLKLKVGPHKITLTNRELGVNDTFSIEIKSRETTQSVKTYPDRIAKPADGGDSTTINPFKKPSL